MNTETLNRMPVAQRAIQNVISELIDKDYDALVGNYGLTREDVDYMRDSIRDYGRTLSAIPTYNLEQSVGAFVSRWSNNTIECWHFDIDLWTEEEGLSDLTLTTHVFVEGNKAWLKFEDLHVL